MTVVTTIGPGESAADHRRHLANCDDVRCIAYAAPKVGSLRFVTELAGSWVSSLPVDLSKWRCPEVRNAIERVAPHVDVVIMDFMYPVPNIPRDLSVPMVYFSHNVEHVIWERLARVETRPWRRGLLQLEAWKMRSAERAFIRRVDATIAVSIPDRDRLQQLAPSARIEAVPTGVDTTYFVPGRVPEVPHRLVFSGSMDWYPNEDAILSFTERIWPAIQRACPTVSMTVVGRHPSERLRERAKAAGMFVTGTVDDVRPFIDEAAVYVTPLRVGGGTRLKIFEAFAMAKPVVSTTIGAEGLGLTSGVEYVAADSDEDFARATVALLRDTEARRRLGERARRLVEERYSWTSVAREFEHTLERVVRARSARKVASDGRLVPSEKGSHQ